MDLNKGLPTLFVYCEKLIWKFFLKFKQGTCPWMAFALIFFPNFSDFSEGGPTGQIIYREYIIFRGSNISCSLATMSVLVLSPFFLKLGLFSVSKAGLQLTTSLQDQVKIVQIITTLILSSPNFSG